MTTTQAEAATSPESPATVPTLQDHAAKLAPFGWTGREAEWLALVALHSGVFTRSQWRHYFDDRRTANWCPASYTGSRKNSRSRTSGPSSPAAHAPCC